MKQSLRQRILPFVADLRDRKVTGRGIAAKLGVTESWVSKTLKDLGVERDKKPTREEERQLRAARLVHRLHAAQTMSVADAAKACDVHPRTITRLLASLPAEPKE